MKKIIVIIIFLSILNRFGAAAEKEISLAMCRPAVSQIRNIIDLYEKEILPVNRLKLICIYHENEEDDYSASFDFVKTNQLDWVTFRPITGTVNRDQLFRTNIWTPQFREIFERTDGIIFTGGMDIPPVLYGQEQQLLTEATTPTRSLYEISFLFHLVGGRGDLSWQPFLGLNPAYPVLGICLGAQSLNVATGGTMIQDIPTMIYKLETVEQVLRQDPERIHSSVYHEKMNPTIQKLSPHFHRIRLDRKSLFHRRMNISAGDHPLVLSSHHQAIDKLGSDLFVTATSLDSRIVEAIEHRRFPNVLGIQFHPEPHTLYRKGLLLRPSPQAEADRNLRAYLEEDGISFPFHRKLWEWFAKVLQKEDI